MRQLLGAWLIATSLYAYAQKENLNARDPRLNEGALFTVTLTPKDKRVVVSLAGKPQAELGPDRVIVFGRELKPNGKFKSFTVHPSGEGFLIEAPLESKRNLEIEVRDRTDTKKRETFRFNLP